ADVDAFFEEVGGDGVAEHVGGHSSRQGHVLAEFADQAADELGGGGAAARVHHEGGAGVAVLRSGFVVGQHQVADLGVGDVDAALAVAFAGDGDDAGGQVDVFVTHCGQLSHADAGGE